jgi:hypothetical protein
MPTTAPAFNADIARKAFAQGQDDEPRRASRAGEWNETYRKFYSAGWEKAFAANEPVRRARLAEDIALLRGLVRDLEIAKGREMMARRLANERAEWAAEAAANR